MHTRDKSNAGTGAVTKSSPGVVATAAADKGGAQQAWNGYVQGLQSGPTEQDGPVGDGGLRRMYTARVPIPGTGEFMYVGRWYYQNVTESQVQSYVRHGQTDSGWFEITKTQFEIQHGATNKSGKVTRKADPQAWTYHVRGPGGEVTRREKMNFGEGVRTDAEGTFWPPDRTSAALEVELSPPPDAPCTATLRALDANGGVRIVATIPIAAGQKSFQTTYVLAKDEALQFVFDLPGEGPLTHVYALVKTSKGGQGGDAHDDMARYGQEMPTAQDVQDLLALRRKRD